MIPTDPVPPWSSDQLGVAGLALLALLVVGLTLWAYAAARGVTPRRLAGLLALRLGGLALVLLPLLRPYHPYIGRAKEPGALYVVVDASESMTILDEENDRRTESLSRWDRMLLDLRAAAPELKRLEERGVEVRFVRFAADTQPFDPDNPGAADGPRTDTGQALRSLWERRDSSRPVAVLVLSDGADNCGAENGGKFRVLEEAERWKTVCPVHAFGYGKDDTSDRRTDVVLTELTTDPTPLVPLKGGLAAVVKIDAPGFKGSPVRLSLSLDDKEARDVKVLVKKDDPANPGKWKWAEEKEPTLRQEAGNVFRLETTAPDRRGELKVTVRADDPKNPGRALPGEATFANNELSTFVTVAKEGLRVLVIDSPRAGEPQAIIQALRSEKRLTVRSVWLGDGPPSPSAVEDFAFERQRYDVIVLGDVTAAQLRRVRPDAVEAIAKQVTDEATATGLVMLGGDFTFGNGDWNGTAIGKLLAIDLSVKGQIERKVKIHPTKAGLTAAEFGALLRLGDRPEDSEKAWASLHDLDGVVKLGKPDPNLATVLAETLSGDPILVASKAGAGRVLSFAADTTHRWRRDPAGLQLHARFWKQLVAWLARQDDAEAAVWARPDVRRLPARAELGFSFGVRNKLGVELRDATFTFAVYDKDGQSVGGVSGATGPGGQRRGSFDRTSKAGEYRLVVTATANDPDAKDEKDRVVKGTAEARFLVYDDDREMTRRQADHPTLQKLADAGGGQFFASPAADLPKLLRSLETELADRAGRHSWPDWQTKGRLPGLPLLLLLAFAAVLSGEWFLRRRWGMV
jgi:uncharacterized membrane protein